MANLKTINWSLISRDSLFSYFHSANSELVGKMLSIDQIHRTLSKNIKSVLPVRIKKCIDPNIDKGHIYTGGMYYSKYDRENKLSIEIIYSYHPDTVSLKLTDYRLRKLAIRFADVVLHEIIHLRQFRARKFKDIPGYQSTAASAKLRKEQTYFGDRDEMGAFAFNIACELVDRFGYDPITIMQYLNSNAATRHKNSWWHSYLKTFNWNHSHNIIQRMKKKILGQLVNAYEGKPFRTNNCLTN